MTFQNYSSLEEMTLRQLRRIASQLNIPRYSRMRKAQLLSAIKIFHARENKDSPENQDHPDNHNQVLSDQTINKSNSQNLSTPIVKGSPKKELPNSANLADVDRDLGDLPGGYNQSTIRLMPRDPQWAYAYWDVSYQQKENLRRQGGEQLALRLYDVTDRDSNYANSHSMQEYFCDELAREWYLPIPLSDRDYMIDIGYRCVDGRWLVLASSSSVRFPPVYQSDWHEDIFINIDWEQDLRGKTSYRLPPAPITQQIDLAKTNQDSHQLFGMGERVAGSLLHLGQHLPGSMIPEQVTSSYIFPSGMGMWALPTASGSGAGLLMSGSGAGFSADLIPARKFWLIADAELIVYGATEPDASVTIAGKPIKLNPNGTFRFQMSFRDGLIDYPIVAHSADRQETRSVKMKFTRETYESEPQPSYQPPDHLHKYLDDTAKVQEPTLGDRDNTLDDWDDIQKDEKDNLLDWFPPLQIDEQS